MRRIALLTLGVLLTGCSGSAIDSPAGVSGARAAAASASPSSTSPSPSSSPAVTAAASGYDTASPSAASSPTGTAHGAAGLSGPQSTGNGIAVTLGSACVAPGGQQAIAITTHGQASVSFNTHYADGKLGQDYGGVRIGVTDTAGNYRDQWTISPSAALGTATVQAGMSQNGRTATAQGLRFTVASHC